MRPTLMKPVLLATAAALLALLPAAPAAAQMSQPTTYKDTSMVKPPAGSRVAIVEWEDLECPACAHAAPIVHQAVDHYHIALVRYDFPLSMHIWSRDAAIIARYIQDKISPQAATEYRLAVFQNQQSIASKDDLQNFTQHYFQVHGRTMPFVVDPQGTFAKEVQADYNSGERLGVVHTPTIFVVAQGHSPQEVNDINNLYSMLDTAIAETGGPESGKKAHTTTARK